MNSNQLTEAIERYLNGEMDEHERARFEEWRRTDAAIDSKIAEHRQFLGALKQYRERTNLEARLNAIHDEMDIHSLVEDMTVHPMWIVRMWRNHHSKISVAASIAIFVVLTAMFFNGYFKKADNYQQLKNELDAVKSSQRRQASTVNKLRSEVGALPKTEATGGSYRGVIIAPKRHMSPGKYQGSGFALSSRGYIVTSYHVIGNNYDSIYVQNNTGEAFRAKVVYTEPQYDVAVLKITDASFNGLPTLPYSFKKSKSDLGESVYSMGFSEGDAPVMDMGYISSANGYQGDSSAYRVSIPLNPGNSGGPLLNAKGNVIGVVAGRQAQTVGASYAIKSSYLYKTLKNIPDSLNKKISLSNNKNTLAGLTRVQQIKKMQDYVFMVKVY